ncbi:beta-propeller fold lactonase family protein [Caulobacter segnis]|uniref:lactonase family protein n=1 Tax=Caulobacter segnis TaxID=88688 RepID=UPI00240F38C6|nr:beta-propeller fold lactonase family protein [Caulobacter segnis]MDG2520368.1 beta-propeller fold lactonase family protein [Caulobacter segnis]
MQPAIALTVGNYDPGGVATVAFDRAAESLTLVGRSRALRNASFGAYDPRRGLWCFVDESDDGALVMARPHGRCGWRRIAAAGTGGAAPCFVAFDPRGEIVAAANYASGSVALFKVAGEGGYLASPPSTYAGAGGGPDRTRQDGPHAHCVRFHAGRLYHTDLGTDEVVVHDYDGVSGALSGARPAFAADPGQGPRHIVFHPSLPVAWLLTELDCCICTLEVRADGSLGLLARNPTVRRPENGDLGGHIALDRAGRRLYVTTRGDDSMTTFAVDGQGSLELMGTAPVGCASPRHFMLMEDERRMLVACEQGGALVALEVLADGQAGPETARVSIPGAAFVALRRVRRRSPRPGGTCMPPR